jgi:hypothetical protein
MSGVADSNERHACCEGGTKTIEFDQRDITCPIRDHRLEERAIEKLLGPEPDADDDVPTPASLGIRAVRVSLFPIFIGIHLLCCRMRLTLSSMNIFMPVVVLALNLYMWLNKDDSDVYGSRILSKGS